MSELGVLDLSGYGAEVVGSAPVKAQISAKIGVPGGPSVAAASPVVPGAPPHPVVAAQPVAPTHPMVAGKPIAPTVKPCPPGYKTAVSKYTGRRLCVPPTPAKDACPPGYFLKFYPMTRKIACSPAPGAQAAQMRAAYRKQMQVKAQKAASRLSTLRTLPGLDEPSQGIKQIAQGGAMGQKQAMVIAAQRRLAGERAQTATMSKLIQHWTGIPQDVDETQVGVGIKKAYTPGAVTAGKGWMPGCRMVCPGGAKPAAPAAPTPAQPMGVRAKIG